jgi:hypothetical protein
MKELFKSFLKTTEERIKNPFIGSFITSWILFNWKPILYLIFSSKDIEQKILYIETTFTIIWCLLIFPLLSAIFYVLILPYLNLLFDWLLRYSSLKKNISLIDKQKQIIQNQKELAIEEIKLEEAKTEFRERKTHNKLLEDLQLKNTINEELLELEKNTNQKIIEELKRELKKREDMTLAELKNSEKRYNQSRMEMNTLNDKLFEKDNELQKFKSMLNNENYSKNRGSIVSFDNGIELIESFEGNKIIYSDNKTKIIYTEKEVNELMKNFKYKKYRN